MPPELERLLEDGEHICERLSCLIADPAAMACIDRAKLFTIAREAHQLADALASLLADAPVVLEFSAKAA